MKQTTKTVSTSLGLQSLWGAVERLSLILIFIMLTTTAAWAEAVNETEVSSWEGLKRVSTVNGSTVTLTQCIKTTATLLISETVTLDLNGYGIRSTASSGAVIEIASGGNLTLKDDATVKPTRYIPLSNGYGSAVSTSAPGGNYLTVSGGYITGSHTSHGVINIGTFTMKGGTICGNYKSGICARATTTLAGGTITGNNEGGVFCNATLTMAGGTITGHNVDDDGAGVYVELGKFIMTGGSITGNNTAGGIHDGGGVYVKKGTCIIAGGTVSGNTAGSGKGNNVYNHQSTDVYIRTDCVDGGIVYLDYPCKQFSFGTGTDGSDAKPFVISDAAGWNGFCKLVVNDIFRDKHYELGNDISVTQMAGGTTNTTRFTGIFDGKSHTLEFNATASENGTAPFLNVAGATIRNLRVTGTIITAYQNAGGIVANAYYPGLTIENCRSSVTINSTYKSGGYHGGILSRIETGTANITGCVFDGKIITGSTTKTRTTNCGGFVGSNQSTVNITDCLYAPAARADGEYVANNDSYTFVRNVLSGSSTITRSYRTRSFGMQQGTFSRSVTAGDEYVTVAAVNPVGNAIATYTTSGITAYAKGIKCDGTFYYGEDDDVSLTLSHSSRTGYFFSGYSANKGTLNGTTLTMPFGNVTISAEWADSNDFSVNAASTEYTIKTAKGWDAFCYALEDNDTYNRFIGKTVYLGDDITVTRMAGSDNHDFCGTFDGQGNTIDLNLDSNKGGYALFRNAVGATIKNLHVTGTITTAVKYAAGLISGKWGDVTIENCRSSVTIKSSVSGDGTHGGFVAVVNNGGTLNIEGCVFDGRLITTNGTAYCGGFVGWNAATTTITNSLYAPAEVNIGVGTGDYPSATFSRNGVSSIANSYYTEAFGEAQGKAARSITAGDNVTLGHAGVATAYSVSGITAYKASGASNDSDPFIAGILYNNDVLYAGEGDEVSLTLSNSAPAPGQGYRYAYTASTGTLSGSTLTMPADDVTVSLAIETIDWAGNGSSANPYTIYNKDQLLLLAYRVNGTHGETADIRHFKDKYFKLGADIKFEHSDNEGDDYEENYEAIGNGQIFQGNFDGNGKTVSGIRIRKTGTGGSDYDQGLFGRIMNSKISNVHVTDARITGYCNIGGIVGRNENGTVKGCTVTESAITAKSHYGTISGINEGITDSRKPRKNYYHGCTVNGEAVISGVGCNGADITENDGAVPMYVDYIDADGKQQRCIDYTELDDEYFGLGDVYTNKDVDLTAGKWYVVKENVLARSFTNSFTVSGSGAANIILCDDKTFDLGCSGKSYIQGSLNIYGQSKGTGEFNYNNNDFVSDTEKTELIEGNLTIYGGLVVLVGHDAGPDTNGQSAISGNVTIHRGSLCAKGGDNIDGDGKNAIDGDVAFYGGSLTAIGGSGSEDDGYGIWGKVALSWSNADDNFYASSYSISTTIAESKAFTDGNGHYYAGTLSGDEMAAIGGQELLPLTAVSLADDASNATAIGKLNGVEDIDITLAGRTLWKDGDWNTLVLPFDVTIEESVLDGADVRALADANLTGEVLTLNFSKEGEVSTIEAGKPYIIKWEKGENLVSPVFKGVTVSSTTDDFESTDHKVYFKGTYAPIAWTEETPSILFLGTGNKLNWPLAGAHLNAFRAYFELDGEAKAREFVMNFDGETTEVVSMYNEQCTMNNRADAWYTVNGVKLDKEPTKPGLYIYKGKKVKKTTD